CRLDLCNQYGRDECPCGHHDGGLADRYVSAGHGSNLWSSACVCNSLSFHLAVTPPWQGRTPRAICTAEVLSHARRLMVTKRRPRGEQMWSASPHIPEIQTRLDFDEGKKDHRRSGYRRRIR